MRGEPSGGDGIHMNVVAGPLSRQIARKCDNPTLAGSVSDRLKLRRRPSPSRNRGNIDNFSVPLPDHDFTHGLRTQERPGQVRFEYLVPVFQAHFFGGSAAGSAGVVNQDIDSAELK